MHQESTKNLLLKIWKDVKERFLFPESPDPEFTELPSPFPAMVIHNRRILINQKFILKYSSRLPLSNLLEGILTHGLAHHAVCPWDLKTHIQLFSEALKITQDAGHARFVTDLFLDTVVDSYCISRGWEKIITILDSIAGGLLHQKILFQLYQSIWGPEELTTESVLDPATIEYLAEIDYLERTSWTKSIRKMARALRNHLPRILKGCNLPVPLMGFHDLLSYNSHELMTSLEALAQEIEDPQYFNEMFSSIKSAYGKLTDGNPSGRMGRSLGHETKASPLFYMALAEKYRMRVRKMEIKKDGALYPFSHEQWSVSDPFYDIDIWNSLGRILPPITVKWKKIEGEVHVTQEKVPDCMIMIDSSGSMPDPSKKLSYAVLGASCAADAYLREGASVSVYNFSDAPAGNRKLIIESRNRIEIYEALCTYFGGGTAIEINLLAKLLTDKHLDIFLITDMEITNLENLVRLFKGLRNVRVTAVYIGEKKGVEWFQKAARGLTNVSIYGIEKPKDIMKIVLGQIDKYIHN